MRRLLTREKKLMSLKVTLKVTRRETAHAPSPSLVISVLLRFFFYLLANEADGACAVSLPGPKKVKSHRCDLPFYGTVS